MLSVYGFITIITVIVVTALIRCIQHCYLLTTVSFDVLKAGSCKLEFCRRVNDGLGRLVSDAFSTGPSSKGTYEDHSVFTSLWGFLGN